MIAVVYRPFKSGGIYYERGSVIADPISLKHFKSLVTGGKLIAFEGEPTHKQKLLIERLEIITGKPVLINKAVKEMPVETTPVETTPAEPKQEATEPIEAKAAAPKQEAKAVAAKATTAKATVAAKAVAKK